MGIFQKILESSRVEIITTKTIMDSFLKKYSLISGMSEEILRKLLKFRPAIIGAPLCLNGAVFRFFYTFHSVPCIGFEVSIQESVFYFSSDTYYEPKM